MSLTTRFEKYIVPLTPEQELKLDNLFNYSVNLLSDSLLPSYSADIKKELLLFIQSVKNDCACGDLKFEDGCTVALNISGWIKSVIELDTHAASEYENTLTETLRRNNSLHAFSSLDLLAGLFAGAIGTLGLMGIYYLKGENFKTSVVHSLSFGGALTLVGISFNHLFFFPRAFWARIHRVSDNFNHFLNQMNQPINDNRFEKNYYQLAEKIYKSIEAKKNTDQIIDLIRQNIINMKDEKVIKNDILEDTFIRRLLDAHITILGTKNTLRNYLQNNDMLDEIREILTAQIKEITDPEVEEEAIREDSMRLNIV